MVFGGIHATLYPEEAHERGGAHAVVTRRWRRGVAAGDRRDAVQGTLQPQYEGGRVDAEQFVPARWDLLPEGRYMWALGADRTRMPEALFVLFGLAHRRAEAAPARRRQRRVGRSSSCAGAGSASSRSPTTTSIPSRSLICAMADAAGQRRPSRPAAGDPRGALRADGAGWRSCPRDMVFFTQITMEAAEDAAFLDAMRRAHIKGALVGVEAVTPEGLKDVYKGFNEVGEALVQRLQKFREHGVHVLGSFIFGLPSDRAVDLRRDGGCRRARGTGLRPVRHADAVSRHASTSRRGRRTVGDEATKVGGIPVTRHWLIPQAQRPKVYTPHPVMAADEIRARTQAVWDRFYSLPRDLGSARACTPSLRVAAGVRADLEALSADVREYRHRDG